MHREYIKKQYFIYKIIYLIHINCLITWILNLHEFSLSRDINYYETIYHTNFMTNFLLHCIPSFRNIQHRSDIMIIQPARFFMENT